VTNQKRGINMFSNLLWLNAGKFYCFFLDEGDLEDSLLVIEEVTKSIVSGDAVPDTLEGVQEGVAMGQYMAGEGFKPDARTERLVAEAAHELDNIIRNVKNQPQELQSFFATMVVTGLATSLTTPDPKSN
jgi:hypothetical protein